MMMERPVLTMTICEKCFEFYFYYVLLIFFFVFKMISAVGKYGNGAI